MDLIAIADFAAGSIITRINQQKLVFFAQLLIHVSFIELKTKSVSNYLLPIPITKGNQNMSFTRPNIALNFFLYYGLNDWQIIQLTISYSVLNRVF